MFVQRLESNFPDTRTEMKKNARIPRAMTFTTTVNRIVASIPMMLMATKMM